MNIKYLQDLLNTSKLKSKEFDKNIKLLELERNYQIYCSKFSPAYLSGSLWYVGPSIIEYINKKPIDNNLLSTLFFISHKIN
jgi:hypothetical protein